MLSTKPMTRRLATTAVVLGSALFGSMGASAQPAPSDVASRYSGKPRMMFIPVPIRDVDRSVKFYREVIGLEVKRERRRENFAEIFMGFPGDAVLATKVMLIWRGGAPPAHGTARVAFETPNAAETFERAKAAGGTVARPPAKGQGSPVLVGEIRDPDGNSLELAQYAP